MGLDITAYRKLERVEHPVFTPDGQDLADWDTQVRAYVNNDFPGRADPIVHGVVYTYAERFSFRAGSYGGYNQWRDQLARYAGWLLGAPGCWNHCAGKPGYDHHDATEPFKELINFSDCEGIIGTYAAQKLLNDFRNEQEKITQQAINNGEDYFVELYRHWMRACEFAADGGMIDFH